MGVETGIGLSDQFAIKTFFADARFIPRNKQNRPTLGIKGESHSPFTIRRTKSQLLHVRMPGAVERVNTRASQVRPKLLQNQRQSQNLRLYVLGKRIELRLKLIADLYGPSHPANMALIPYDVSSIF